MVHLQPYHGGSPVCGDALNFEGALFRPLKMVCPCLCPRVEQGHRLPRSWIFAVDVCLLVGVAMRTRKCQIGHLRLSASRSRQNMVHLKTADLQLCRQLTVFTAVASPSDHLVSDGVGARAHPSDSTPGSAVRRRSKAA